MILLILLDIVIVFLNGANGIPFYSSSDLIEVDMAVSYLNHIKGRTWTAGQNNFGNYISKSELQSRMGFGKIFQHGETIDAQNSEVVLKEILEVEKNKDIYDENEIPEEYDTRTMFPHCTTISSIKDQSRCGSCWAVSTAAAFSDRLCIHSKGLINVNISSTHLMSCSRNEKLRGCRGGFMKEAWDFIKDHGLVTGGDYDMFEGCQPYKIAPCGHRWLMPCKSTASLTPKCQGNSCFNDFYSQSEEKPYRTKSTITLPCNETHPCDEKLIRREIYLNGPVTAAIQVYLPFVFYKSGVFQINTKEHESIGGHAVRIIGWGIEEKNPYWIVANSWSVLWGNQGTGKILRGKNQCGIESYIHGGIPDVPSDIN